MEISRIGNGLFLIGNEPPKNGQYLSLRVEVGRCDWMKAQPDAAVQLPGFVGKLTDTVSGPVLRYRPSLEPDAMLFDISVTDKGLLVAGHSGFMNKQQTQELIDLLELLKTQAPE